MRSTIENGVYVGRVTSDTLKTALDWTMLGEKLKEMFPEKVVYLAEGNKSRGESSWRLDNKIRILLGILPYKIFENILVDKISLPTRDGRGQEELTLSAALCYSNPGYPPPFAVAQVWFNTICIGLDFIPGVTAVDSKHREFSMTDLLLEIVDRHKEEILLSEENSEVIFCDCFDTAIRFPASICNVQGNEMAFSDRTTRLINTRAVIPTGQTSLLIPVGGPEEMRDAAQELRAILSLDNGSPWLICTPNSIVPQDGGVVSRRTPMALSQLYLSSVAAQADSTLKEAAIAANDILAAAKGDAQAIVDRAQRENIIYPPAEKVRGSYFEGMVSKGKGAYQFTFPIYWQYETLTFSRSPGKGIPIKSLLTSLGISRKIGTSCAFAVVGIKWSGGKTCSITDINLFRLASKEVMTGATIKPFPGYHVYTDRSALCFDKKEAASVEMSSDEIYGFVRKLLSTINKDSLTRRKGDSSAVNALLAKDARLEELIIPIREGKKTGVVWEAAKRVRRT